MIIDDAVSPSLFGKIKDFLCTNKCAWYYHSGIARPLEKEVLFEYGFAHMVMDDGEYRSSIAPLLHSAILCVLDASSEPVENIRRIRVGLLTATESPMAHPPHVDFFTPHKTGILYMNDSDGDTILYNEHFSENQETTNFNIKNTVTPKENRVLLFDGLQYHGSSSPTKNNCRIVVNFNYNFK